MIYSNIKIFCVLFCTTTILGSWFSPQPDISSHKMWIDKYACEFSIDENLVAAMIMTESGGDVKAVSTKGAQGIMQITPATAKNLCKKLNIHFSADMLWQAERNIFLGCYYIHHLLNTFDGCIVLALAAYNCGPNRVRGWRQKTPHLTTWKILETHASSETKHFVWSVLYRYRNRNQVKTMERFLQTVELVKVYKKRRVVDKVSLRIEPGKVIGLLGANGAGKSTTFRMVAGLVRPDYGRIVLDGKDISHLPMYMRARIGIGYLPQEATIFRRLTVRDNIMVVLQHLKLSVKERKKLLESLLEEMNLKHLEKTYAERLSGGERRRLEVTRLLSTSPSFMMWDEPFAAVDPIIVEYLQKIIVELKQKGIGILITDHKPKETLAISDYVYVMHQGKILVEDVPDVVATNSTVQQVYLGDSVANNAPKTDKEKVLSSVKVHLEQQEYEKALEILADVFAGNLDCDIRLLRGKCFLGLEEYPSAIFDFQKVLKSSPENKEAKECLQQAQSFLSTS